MSEETETTAIADKEILARFVLFSGWLRGGNKVKPDAFMPPRNLELSVTRQLDLSQEDLWQIGRRIAELRSNAKLHGRADITADIARKQSLDVKPTPQPRNHANIVGWPNEKSAQKIIAQEISAAASSPSRHGIASLLCSVESGRRDDGWRLSGSASAIGVLSFMIVL